MVKEEIFEFYFEFGDCSGDQTIGLLHVACPFVIENMDFRFGLIDAVLDVAEFFTGASHVLTKRIFDFTTMELKTHSYKISNKCI